MSFARETMTDRPRQNSSTASVDADEVARFAALATDWWDPEGPMKPLHALTPARLRFIRAQIDQHFGMEKGSLTPLEGLHVADVGCGGGIVAEPLARMGGAVTAIDAAAENIEVARAHAAQQELEIDYRATTAEALMETGARFHMVTALEIIEHVTDPAEFVQSCAALLKPGGLLILSTLNRTPKAWALAIGGAEYVMRWLPVGTHDWNKFIRPSELAAMCRAAGLVIDRQQGLVFDPLTFSWGLSDRDLDVNYLVAARRPSS